MHHRWLPCIVLLGVSVVSGSTLFCFPQDSDGSPLLNSSTIETQPGSAIKLVCQYEDAGDCTYVVSVTLVYAVVPGPYRAFRVDRGCPAPLPVREGSLPSPSKFRNYELDSLEHDVQSSYINRYTAWIHVGPGAIQKSSGAEHGSPRASSPPNGGSSSSTSSTSSPVGVTPAQVVGGSTYVLSSSGARYHG
jgi:hypothetical protein